jgi:hypothetical protein
VGEYDFLEASGVDEVESFEFLDLRDLGLYLFVDHLYLAAGGVELVLDGALFNVDIAEQLGRFIDVDVDLLVDEFELGSVGFLHFLVDGNELLQFVVDALGVLQQFLDDSGKVLGNFLLVLLTGFEILDH